MSTEINKEQGIREMKELLEVMSRALVDEPDRVEVNPIDTGERIVLELRVADEDMGRVIGKGGRRAQAMRSIIKAKATRVGLRSAVDIIDREEDQAKSDYVETSEDEYEDSYDEEFEEYEEDDDFDYDDDDDEDDYEYSDDEDFDYVDDDEDFA